MPKPVIRVITDIPTVENTDLSTSYESSAPSTYALDDKNVLYFGSESWDLTLKCIIRDDSVTIPFRINELGNELTIQKLQMYDISSIDPVNSTITLKTWLFVLNSNLTLWFPNLQSGLEIPYRSIILHAVNVDKIYFQIECSGGVISNLNTNLNSTDNDDQFVEVYATPTHLTADVSYHLFNSFRHLDNSKMLERAYVSICECSSLFIDSTSDEDGEEDGWCDQPVDNLNHAHNNDDGPALASNSGNADDLNDALETEGEENFGDASGMDVDIQGAFSYATKRKEHENDNDDDDDDSYKMYSKNRKTK